MFKHLQLQLFTKQKIYIKNAKLEWLGLGKKTIKV